MTKKQICMTNVPIAVMGLTNTSGVAIHHVEYGIDDHVYASYNSGDAATYHKCKVHTSSNGEMFFYIGKLKLNLSNFMRV